MMKPAPHHARLTPPSASAARRAAAGFTLVEIMIVVAIMALVLGIGVPAMFRAADKSSLRQVVMDIADACAATRAQAILSGQPKELVIRPIDHTITAPGMSETIIIPERIIIELLGINFIEMQHTEEARVRFWPNSTSDEFTILLHGDGNEWRKISLDVVTAMADVDSDPHQMAH